MAKKKITVTVDEELLDRLRAAGIDNLSAVVNSALTEYERRLARHEALGSLLDELLAAHGPITDEARAASAAAWAELDGPSAADAREVIDAA